MPIGEANLHYGTAKGKEIFKKRAEERLCEVNPEINARIKAVIYATAQGAYRHRMEAINCNTTSGVRVIIATRERIRFLLVTRLTLSVENASLHVLQQALSSSENYRQYRMALILCTRIDAPNILS